MTITTIAPTEAPAQTGFRATTIQTALLDALAFIVATLPSRSVLPVLSGVLIEATDEGISLGGTDFEVTARIHLAGVGQGKILVPAKLLHGIVKDLTKGCDVELYLEEGKVVVAADGFTYRVPTLVLDDYPTLPSEAPSHVTDLDKDNRAGLSSVLTAAGKGDVLPVLSAVLFDATKDTLVAAATDRYRLAVYDTGIHTFKSTPSFLVPAPALAIVIKQFAKAKNVRLSVATEKVKDGTTVVLATFTDGTRSLSTRTIDGQFPKYGSLLPDPSNYAATSTLPAKDLVKAIKGVARIASRTSPIYIELDETATLSSGGRGTDDSEARCTLTPSTRDGESMTIAVNPTYLLDGIWALGSDEITISLSGPTKPIMLTAADRADLLYLQMPVRVPS